MTYILTCKLYNKLITWLFLSECKGCMNIMIHVLELEFSSVVNIMIFTCTVFNVQGIWKYHNIDSYHPVAYQTMW